MLAIQKKQGYSSVMSINREKKYINNPPSVTDLGDAKDLVKGIIGDDKEPGGFDNEFAPLQISGNG